MKMEQTECSETSAYKIQTPGNYLEESIQHSEHGEILKSRIFAFDTPVGSPFSHKSSPYGLTQLCWRLMTTKTGAASDILR
jgi:hypothetical protein